MGRAVGMRRKRAWIRLLNDWDASTSCASCAQTELERELGMSFDKQLECSELFEQFDKSCLGSTNLPGSCLHAEGSNSPPCGHYLLQK
jgi:hypothetical protein